MGLVLLGTACGGEAASVEGPPTRATTAEQGAPLASGSAATAIESAGPASVAVTAESSTRTPASVATPRPAVTVTQTSTPTIPAIPATPEEVPPVLSVSIIDISGTYDPTTARLGDLYCAYRFESDANDRWCFGAFGASAVPGKQAVSLDYKVVARAPVAAATSGVVVAIEAETNPLYPGEFEIRTQSSPDSAYLVIYDHVRELEVEVGSAVQPGQRLGVAGVHTADPSRFGRVELQVNYYPDLPDRQRSTIICPQQLGTATFRAANEAALAAHNLANPAFASSAVCLVDQISH